MNHYIGRYLVDILGIRGGQSECLPSVATIPSTPGCGNAAAEADEVRTTLLIDPSGCLAAASKTVSVAETTFGITSPAFGLKETSDA